MKGYYFITDSSLSKAGNLNDVRNAVKAGVEVVQYRNKSGAAKELYKEAVELRKFCRNVLLLINDRIDIALAVEADGVHLGQDDLPYSAARKLLGKKKVIGITVHSVEEALAASEAGADYLGISPIFETATKSDAGRPSGIELIKNIKKLVSIPLVAIGGINLANSAEVIKAGADSLCAISAVVTKENVKEEIERFREVFRKYGK